MQTKWNRLSLTPTSREHQLLTKPIHEILERIGHRQNQPAFHTMLYIACHTFCPVPTRRKFNVFRRWNSIAKRYFLAGRRDFGTETKFSQVLDASRFLNDSLEGVLGAVKPSEGGHEMLVAWCPPQELQQILSFGDILNLQLFTSSNSTRSCFDYTFLTFFFKKGSPKQLSIFNFYYKTR